MSRAATSWSVIVSAEHGGNEVPPEHRNLFAGRGGLLGSHRGWDAGTLALAGTLADELDAPAFTSRLTRLLVDLNRSTHNPRVFSEITRQLPREERATLLERFHAPHWERVRAAVSQHVSERRPVLHLGVHSFTPVFGGEVRKPDIALLYDPARQVERDFAVRWADALAEALPGRVVRRNSPYSGASDGLTTALRRVFSPARYMGIEIEVSQRHVGPNGAFPDWVAGALLETLRGLLRG